MLRINPAVLRKSRTLLCMDSYGNSQCAEQYTTPNVTTMVLPGARLITVAKAAATLSTQAMDAPSEVILFASTNDYLTSHTAMLARQRHPNVSTVSQDAADAALDFVDSLMRMDFTKFDRNVRVFYVAPLLVQSPHIFDNDHKAHGLAIFNDAVRADLRNRIRHGQTPPVEIVFVDEEWWLSADQVHLRAYQLPMLLLHIERAVHRQHDALPQMIDCPQAATTLYYKGHQAYRRITESTTRNENQKRRAIKELAGQESSTLKKFPRSEPCKSLDDHQLPAQTPALITPNPLIQTAHDELMSPQTHKGVEVVQEERQWTFHPQNSNPTGPIAQRIQLIIRRLYKTMTLSKFLSIVTHSIRQLVDQNLLMTEDIVKLIDIFKLSQGWLKFDAFIESESQKTAKTADAKRASQDTSTPFRRDRMVDISLRDLAILTILFPQSFDLGPKAFWPKSDQITPNQWHTFATLLDRKTLTYISYGQSRRSTVITQTRGVQMQWLAMLRNTLLAKGGMCQAQLEHETGLHLTHLQTLLTPTTLTAILGRKSHNPLATPAAYKEGDVNIFFFADYITGTEFRPKTSNPRVVWTHELRLWKNGFDTLCDAESETLKALGPLSVIYPDVMGAINDANIAMGRPRPSRTTAPAVTSKPQVISVTTESDVQSAVVPGIGPIFVTERHISLHDDDSENDDARRSTSTRDAAQPTVRPQQAQDAPPPPPPPPPPPSSHSQSSHGSKKRKRSKKSKKATQQSPPTSPVRKRLHTHPQPTESDLSEADAFVVEPAEASSQSDTSCSTSTTASHSAATPSTSKQASQPSKDAVARTHPTTSALGEGEFGAHAQRNAEGCDSARLQHLRGYLQDVIQFGHEDVVGSIKSIKDSNAFGLERDDKRKISTYHLRNPEIGGNQYQEKTQSWSLQTREHLYRTLRETDWITEEADTEQWAQLANFAGKILGGNLSRICLGCGKIVPDTEATCTCDVMRQSTSQIYPRCFPDQLTKLMHSIMCYPGSRSGQNEKVMSIMSSTSWREVFGKGQTVGLDVIVWQCDLTVEDDDAFLKVYNIKERNKQDTTMLNIPVCIKAALATKDEGLTEHKVIMAQRYHIPTTRTTARLMHSRAPALSSRILELIDRLIESTEEEEKATLEEEKRSFRNAWLGAKGYRGGKAYKTDAKMSETFKYLRRGYRNSTWHKELDESDRDLFASLVEAEDGDVTITIDQIERENPDHCAFSATQDLHRNCWR